MRLTVAAACALLLLGGTRTGSQTAFMPVEEVLPGMQGTGFTVFQGDGPSPPAFTSSGRSTTSSAPGGR